jgi:hypothetical protein
MLLLRQIQVVEHRNESVYNISTAMPPAQCISFVYCSFAGIGEFRDLVNP